MITFRANMRFSILKKTSPSDAPDGVRIPSPDQDEEKAVSSEQESDGENDETQYPSFKIAFPTIIAIYLAAFLVSLDRTIVGVAVPKISDQFKSFGDISWYESGYLLTFCASGLPLGRVYTIFPPKWVFITVIALFEIGSIISAAAPSSIAFIVGRAISGLGGGGTFSGAQILLVGLVPLQKRAKYTGFLGAVFGLSSVIGPLMGGAFTSKVTWRWCFWINVPIGGASIILLAWLMPNSPPAIRVKGSTLDKLRRLDPIGTIILVPGLVCLVLALQYGANKYTWSDARVIALLVVGCILLLCFGGVQVYLKDEATVPTRIFTQRSIFLGFFISLCVGSVLVNVPFYLPIWFQAIKGVSAVDAGIRLLPYFMGSVITVISCGIIISKTGYYTPWLIAGTAIMIAGSALLTTLRVNTGTGDWIGYQILVGAGTGMALQQTSNAANTVLSPKDIPIGVTIIQFANIAGSTVFVSVCQAILSSTLKLGLAGSGIDPSIIVHAGATDIRTLVGKDKLQLVLEAYNLGVDRLFYVSVGLSSLAFVCSLFMEWKSMKTSS
ncbi:major facilitator superfamily protein [Lophiotrema nucula]|uniref:Major facilitator superfamily protein n=1 Tax=Lophiotrema nucula TaxID=690887 RepID=A0A6A5Z4Q4_9PLEO|nr:major facilitator superfamily protein [Lophiotrema nucula]